MELFESSCMFEVLNQVKLQCQLHSDVRHIALFDFLNWEWAGLSATWLFHSTISRAGDHLSIVGVESTQDVLVSDGLEQVGLEQERALSLGIILHEEFQGNLFWWVVTLGLQVSGEPDEALGTLPERLVQSIPCVKYVARLHH